MPDYIAERQLAVEAARCAGRLCLEVRREMLGDHPDEDRIEKAGKEPVTIADYGAQAVILALIAQQFPYDATMAEERASEFVTLTGEGQKKAVLEHVQNATDQAMTLGDIHKWLDHGRDLHSTRIWTIDPIDGTKGFLRGDQFAVAVALLVDGEPVVGALCCPLLPYDDTVKRSGLVASAIKRQGATIEIMDASITRSLEVSREGIPLHGRTVESVESGHTDHSFSQDVLMEAGIGGVPVRMDSQAKYIAVADGRAEIYLRNSRGDYREKIWDHAAGVLIVQEAGGSVTDLDGKPLDFSKGQKLSENRGILATNGLLHDPLLSAIQEVETAAAG